MTSSTVIIYQGIIYQIFWSLLAEPNSSEAHRVVKDWWKVMRFNCWAFARAYSWYGSLFISLNMYVLCISTSTASIPQQLWFKIKLFVKCRLCAWACSHGGRFHTRRTYLSKFFWIRLDIGFPWNIHIDSVCTKLVFGIYVIRSFAKYSPTNVPYCTILKLYMYWPNLPTYFIRLFWCACANAKFFRAFRLLKKAIKIDAKINITEFWWPAF